MSQPSPPTELLAPAKDLECGIAAIDCGADAVYVGAARFGARESAGNSLDDIAALIRHAHRYRARVYATVNTLLRDSELPEALRLIEGLHAAGIDGLILQDPGLLECDLPPLPLIASTQMRNHTPERVAFLEQVGFQRAILARELDLEQIRAIRAAAPRIELECFVHGALCVGYSGQCYLSCALGGRSGNRGQCAQPCRKPYTLVDAKGRVISERRHLLSLRDLNLSDHLGDLLDAGVASFKIEGRLKDKAYVSNVVAAYRARLDAALAARGLRRSSSGVSRPGFEPDLHKTFNRGYTTYFLLGRSEPVGSLDTPKMTGEPVGHVKAVLGSDITLDAATSLHPGDGLCYFDAAGELRGATVNAVSGNLVTLEKPEGLRKGTQLFRNHDHQFLTRLKKSQPERKIRVRLTLCPAPDGLLLTAEDEDGVRAQSALACPLDPAQKPEAAAESIRKQLAKSGGTPFLCESVALEMETIPFVPLATLNALRRDALERLETIREEQRSRPRGGVLRNSVPFPESALSFTGNVLNQKAAAFYRRHGVTRIEPAAESGLDLRGRTIMTTRYCLREQLGLCQKHNSAPAQPWTEPLTLIDIEGNRLSLRFHCNRCEMEVCLNKRAK